MSRIDDDVKFEWLKEGYERIPKEHIGYINCPHCFKSYKIDMRIKYSKCFVCYCPCYNENRRQKQKGAFNTYYTKFGRD